MAAVCPDVENPSVALDIGQRLARALSGRINIGTDAVELRASIGIAWTVEPLDADGFVAQADSAMYQSKQLQQSTASLFIAPQPGAEPEKCAYADHAVNGDEIS